MLSLIYSEVISVITDTTQVPVKELVENLFLILEKKQYSHGYIRTAHRIYQHLVNYCQENNMQYFSTELAQKFLKDCYNVQPGTVERRTSYQHRAMDMLLDFQNFGTIMVKRRLNRQFPIQFEDTAKAYLSHMEKNYARPNTITSHRNSLFKFTDFLDSRGIDSVTNISLDDANMYIKTILCNYSHHVSRLHMGIMKKFLRYLFESDNIRDDISSKLITMRFSNTLVNLPTTFTQEEINKMLSCVDRKSPMGKRDYAILMLAAKLGLRTSDIRNLTPQNIDWEKHEIRITQIKTGEPLILPLPTDVGWAIIDYLKNARPQVDEKRIFLQIIAPYDVLQNLDNVLIRYMRRAGISYKRLKHHGLHTLRHSLATHMLEQQIPITTIQSVLGHVNAQTTMRYTAIDVNQLKQCALEVLSYDE